MQSGELRHRISLQRLATGSPQRMPMGAPDAAWGEVAQVWANVRDLGGRELMAAQQMQSKVDSEIVMRYATAAAYSITAADRVSFRGAYYTIEAVLTFVEMDKTVLRCSRGLNQG